MFAIIVLSTTSCATILTGTKDSITFNSQPEGATVFHKGVEKCVTPCTAEITRGVAKQVVELKKDGYENKEMQLNKKFNAVSLVNILLGGIIGIGVDLASGSFVKYDQKSYTTELLEK